MNNQAIQIISKATSLFVFFLMAFGILIILPPDLLYNQEVSGIMNTDTRYYNLDDLTNKYCRNSETVIIEPFQIHSCQRSRIVLSGGQIFLLLMLLVFPLFAYIVMIGLTCTNLYNKHYLRAALGTLTLVFLTMFLIVFFLRYKPYTPNNLIVPVINPGHMSKYDADNNITKTCQFDSTLTFKECYCELTPAYIIKIPGQVCSRTLNIYWSGLISSALATTICIILNLMTYPRR